MAILQRLGRDAATIRYACEDGYVPCSCSSSSPPSPPCMRVSAATAGSSTESAPATTGYRSSTSPAAISAASVHSTIRRMLSSVARGCAPAAHHCLAILHTHLCEVSKNRRARSIICALSQQHDLVDMNRVFVSGLWIERELTWNAPIFGASTASRLTSGQHVPELLRHGVCAGVWMLHSCPRCWLAFHCIEKLNHLQTQHKSLSDWEARTPNEREKEALCCEAGAGQSKHFTTPQQGATLPL